MNGKKKLHIAMVCDSVSDCLAGSFVSTLRFAQALKDKGHTIIFISARTSVNRTHGFYKGIKEHRFPSVLLPKTEGSFYLGFPTVSQLNRIFQEEHIDVVHVFLPTPATIIALKAAKRMGIKIVAHSHAQPENVLLVLPRILSVLHGPLGRLYYKYLAWIYRQAHSIIYPTEFAKNFFPDLHAINHRVISNGVDTTKFKKIAKADAAVRFNVKPTEKNIVYVGRLHPEKSVDTLIKAVPHIISKQPDAHIYIVGAGHQDKLLEGLARKLHIQDYVTFLGKVSDEDLVPAYNLGDIFVLPSLAELEGMAVLEALACGLPVIVANAPSSAARYFVRENGLLFDPGNERDLAKKVITLLENDSLRESMAQTSLAMSKRYDLTKSIELLEEVYYSVIRHS